MEFDKKAFEEHQKSLEESIITLIDSVAREEDALVKMINAAAEHIETFSGKKQDFPTSPTNTDILEFNKSMNKFMDSMLMKHWILLKKMDKIVELKKNSNYFNVDENEEDIKILMEDFQEAEE